MNSPPRTGEGPGEGCSRGVWNLAPGQESIFEETRMRFSRLFGTTLRQASGDTEGYRLLIRAAMIRQHAAGIYSYLPLGLRVYHKIAQIIREEMNAVDGQEILMPVLNPAELWQETGRWYAIGPELFRLQDRHRRDLVLAMTNEETVTDLARHEIASYRQLPCVLYHIQTKERDEPRPRAGLIRLREFTMKDAYSFHADQADLDAYYPRMVQAYLNIFCRVGLPVQAVEADAGMMGGTGSHEYMLPAEFGEDTLVRCAACGYAANMEAARGAKGETRFLKENGFLEPVEAVDTPGVTTIAALIEFFGIAPENFLKTVAYSVDEGRELVLAVIRGDLAINEVKLAKVLGTTDFVLASEGELQAHGTTGGFISPVGLTGVRVIADDSVETVDEFVAGGNKADVHLRHVRLGRDFRPHVVADIALVRDGDGCPHCGQPLAVLRGVELGHTFKLGVKYSQAMGAKYLDAEGNEQTMFMGCYGIGLDRLMAAVAEHHHDERGLIWPRAIAPYQVILVGLQLDRPTVAEAAEKLYTALQAQGLEVLFDDRAASPGVKFADADLIGIPVRVVVSPRGVEAGSAELKLRTAGQKQLVSLAEVPSAVGDLLRQAL